MVADYKQKMVEQLMTFLANFNLLRLLYVNKGVILNLKKYGD
jgi:hypothetical protein